MFLRQFPWAVFTLLPQIDLLPRSLSKSVLKYIETTQDFFIMLLSRYHPLTPITWYFATTYRIWRNSTAEFLRIHMLLGAVPGILSYKFRSQVPMSWLARWFAVYAPSVYPTRPMVVVDFHHTIVEVLSLSFFPSILFLLYFFPKSVTLFAIMLPINTESTRSPGIRALCSQLGYNEAKESPRHYTCLATPLRQFRS